MPRRYSTEFPNAGDHEPTLVTGGSPGSPSGGGAAAGEVMDDDEQFEHMQMTRVLETEPESLAFVRARKAQAIRHAHKKAPGRR